VEPAAHSRLCCARAALVVALRQLDVSTAGTAHAEFLYIRNFRPERWPAGDPVMLRTMARPLARTGGYKDIDSGPTLDFLIAKAMTRRSASTFNSPSKSARRGIVPDHQGFGLPATTWQTIRSLPA